MTESHNGEGTAIAPMEPGMFQYLEEGEDVTFSEPAEVGGSYEVFQFRDIDGDRSGCGAAVSFGNVGCLKGELLESPRFAG